MKKGDKMAEKTCLVIGGGRGMGAATAEMQKEVINSH